MNDEVTMIWDESKLLEVLQKTIVSRLQINK